LVNAAFSIIPIVMMVDMDVATYEITPLACCLNQGLYVGVVTWTVMLDKVLFI
jgi:hypothetical protein